MARKKHKKIAEVRTFPNVFDYKNENVEEELIQFFNSHKNFIAELGCGQADYSINLALNFTEKNFIGIDRKANRIWNASKNATLQNLNNVVFLISYVEKLEEIFRKIKFEEIWITFPDPYPRNGSVKKRLTHPRFLNIYKNLLSPNGKINLKTDDDTLYSYTLKVIKGENLKLHYETNDLYANENLPFEYSIKTKYEKMHLEEGKKIKLISFSF
ncbi:tRNA (guanosine(46)-N7)-methyltransferase TrmB [Stygiobacter electus]|uniref:tRNA (guanine(46)-N(7))-methyltransferase n=1 Tax=Stygiobacter electus TaxID=3032292 RepID=A0AAE3P354_9BACT|nr:tRNA (guanosine(46)-N7)-methyltransferase TrmB [Stygiobacter electus]MDF1612025.1 tRNA (guanosine(46)-N7)-methyltransferase TrmB [Stygiobacter electus]